jgi:hypothetical protein
MSTPAEGAFLRSLEEAISAITAGQVAVTKAQETLDKWTARLDQCYDSRKPSSDFSDDKNKEIYWLTEQVDKAREALAKREEALAKSREELAKREKALEKSSECHLKLVDSGKALVFFIF